MKVLLSAYACSPFQGSEPGVGWGFVSALAREHCVHVIVEEEKFKQDLERYAESAAKNPNLHFHFIAKRRNRWLRKLWPPSYYWYYREWQERAYELASRLHSEIGFDVVHQLTMVGFREPGYLWKLGVPFVWGPMGGLGLLPWRLLPELGVRSAFYYCAYNVINSFQERLLPRPRSAARAAGRGLITATPTDQANVRELWGCESTVLAEVGLPPNPATQPSQRFPGQPLEIIWSGAHLPRKALGLGLKALAQVPQSIDWKLHVLGEGPCTDRWRAESLRLGIAERCIFHGKLSRQVALDVARGCHVSLITSIRELTSTVTVEALGLGLPVVCLDLWGMSAAIDHTCGLKVAPRSRAQVVRDLAAAIVDMADEDRRQALAAGALKRSQAFAWQRKSDVLSAVYSERIGIRADHDSDGLPTIAARRN